jgi:hypothetical protein
MAAEAQYPKILVVVIVFHSIFVMYTQNFRSDKEEKFRLQLSQILPEELYLAPKSRIFVSRKWLLERLQESREVVNRSALQFVTIAMLGRPEDLIPGLDSKCTDDTRYRCPKGRPESGEQAWDTVLNLGRVEMK